MDEKSGKMIFLGSPLGVLTQIGEGRHERYSLVKFKCQAHAERWLTQSVTGRQLSQFCYRRLAEYH